MSESENTRPHRMTLSEVVERLTERRSSSVAVPTFEINAKAPTAEQSKAGILTVYQWAVTVPVGDDYPTADDAFAAARRYADELRQAYPPDQKGDDLAAKLGASVTELSRPKPGKP